jgi:hypothetical protein
MFIVDLEHLTEWNASSVIKRFVGRVCGLSRDVARVEWVEGLELS